jgi:diguanylate cyclase (GGDEF)-like protein
VQSVTLLTGVAAIVLGTLAFSGIRRNRYDEHMTRLATRDALTGIFNRGTLMDLGHKSVSAAVRARQPVSVLMLDLDHFKRVNDRFGHACGDRMLEKVTAIVAEKLREEDVLGRYGGEEFCVVLPNTDTEGARITSERIRTAIEAHEFELGSARTRITVSIGVATLAPTGSATLESLVMRADAALYQAKRRGRNRVVIAAPEASPAPGAAGAP